MAISASASSLYMDASITSLGLFYRLPSKHAVGKSEKQSIQGHKITTCRHCYRVPFTNLLRQRQNTSCRHGLLFRSACRDWRLNAASLPNTGFPASATGATQTASAIPAALLFDRRHDTRAQAITAAVFSEQDISGFAATTFTEI